MKPKSIFLFILFSLLLVLPLSAARLPPAQAETDAPTAAVLRVNQGGATTWPCGDTWANACALSTSLTNAVSGDELWVAAGIHIPTTVDPDPRNATFLLVNGVAVYGGFAGTETTRGQRNPVSNVTTLSGDIGTAGTNTDNAYHVVTGVTGATLDGFTVTGGNANGGGDCPSANCGGGMHNVNSSPMVTNVTFSGNSAKYGGGMANYSSSPIVTYSTFSNNSTSWSGYGGGMYNASNSNPTLVNVTFSGNSATWSGYGGGMYNTSSSNPTMMSVTISGNLAFYGGGICNETNSNPTIRNTVLWGNSGNNGTQIYNDASTPVISDSVVQGGYAGGTNIITSTPGLGTLGNYGGATATIPLLPGSSAFDVGNPNYCTTGNDQRGIPYVGPCDIGAFEYNFQGAYFVKLTATGAANCESWANVCALQTALNTVVSGEIWVMAGTHTPTTGTNRNATFRLKNGVAVYGGFAGTETAREQRDPAVNVTILSGNIGDAGTNADNSYHVVTGVTGVTEATLDGFTVKGGNANGSGGCPGTACGGGMYNVSSDPTVTSVVFDENFAQYGGGMYSSNSSPVVMNVIFRGNSAIYNGGGMYNVSSDPTVTSVTFDGNSAQNGGGVYNSNSSPAVTDVTFTDNLASTNGGGMYNYSSSHPSVTNVIFSGNSASTNGGGMSNYSSNPTVTDVTFDGNSAVWYGGGMYNDRSSPAVTNVAFSANTATNYGGGISNYISSNPTVTNATFSSNSAVWGGGIYNDRSSPTVTNATFSSNMALWGGGMYNDSSSPTVTNVTFNGNSAGSDGGGMSNESGSHPMVTNVTFSGNTAGHTGGGIDNSSSHPTVTNVTFSGNSAGWYGGGIFNYISNPTIRNTLLWENTAPNGVQIYDLSSMPVVSDSVVQGGYVGGTNILTADPRLGALGNYGSSTQSIPLLPGSSAVQTTSANCPATDQRGMVRGTTCDIGAFESQGFTLTITGGDNQTALLDTPFSLPLMLSVTANDPIEPVEGGLITFTIPITGASALLSDSLVTIISTTVSLTATANSLAGTYTVTASTHGAASIFFTLTNEKWPATVTLSNLTQIYDGMPKPVTVTTIPEGLTVSVSYDDSPTPPINAGTYDVVALVNDPFYQGKASDTLTINRATATVTLSNLTQTYDGKPKPVTVTTVPEGLSVNVTYDGSSTPPTNAGTYTVVASVDEPNYEGGAIGTLIINPATATIKLSNLTQTYDGSPKSVTVTTVPPGVSVIVTYDDSLTPPTNAGVYAVIVTVDDPNYQGSANRTLTIYQATATVTLSDLSHIYDGMPKTVTASTVPEGLAVDVTYNGSPTPPTDAGKYELIATIDDPNYEGSANGMLTINKALVTIALSNLMQTYDGTPKIVTITTTPEGIAVEVTYNGSLTAPTDVGSYEVVVTVTDPNYEGTATVTLTIIPAISVFSVYIPLAVR